MVDAGGEWRLARGPLLVKQEEGKRGGLVVGVEFEDRVEATTLDLSVGGLGGNMRKLEPAFVPESPWARAQSPPVRCKRCWAAYLTRAFAGKGSKRR